jgi:hypothetical protein
MAEQNKRVQVYRWDNIGAAINTAAFGGAEGIAVATPAFATGQWLPVYSAVSRCRRLTIYNTDGSHTIYYSGQGDNANTNDAIPVSANSSEVVMWLDEGGAGGRFLGQLLCYVWCAAGTTGIPVFKFEQ